VGDLYCGEEVLDSFVGQIVDLETEGWFREGLWRMRGMWSVARGVAMNFLLCLIGREIFLVVIVIIIIIVVYSANDCFFCS